MTADTLFPPEWSDRIALIVEPSGARMTFGELEARSNTVAHLLRARGLTPGSTVALLMENRAEFFVIAWAAQRTGLYYVGVNSHLTSPEIEYIVRDSGATALFASAAQLGAAAVASSDVEHRFVVDPANDHTGWEALGIALDGFPETAVPDQSEGDFLLYSSGTTGRPKGIQRPLPGGPLGSYPDAPGRWLRELLGFRPGDVYLCPAPIYHAAPLGWSMGAQRSGGTVVMLERFDAQSALAAIETHRVTHAQWVPTMFVRMLKLAPEIRQRYDLSSQRVAVHAAAPCPIAVKRAMIDWWGPILFEFYSSTEGMGATAIRSEDWLRKPGSVGLPLLGRPLILDDHGRELAAGEIGTVWFEGGTSFSYRGDPGRTAAVVDDKGRATVGDLGYLDEDGYLYLADRRTDLIISGGVNIYPREIEDVLILHPGVLDVAVIGAPDPDLGRRVVAVVQPAASGVVGAEELLEHCRARLARFKVPREVRFVEQLPRTPTGKLRKHLIADEPA
ncbi:acyl-CoA synthetase [Nocardia sp. alder85J]|uniref:acyl-CoA synthetase n=1 Tax=Nocardia sp. alder85J TaxID=2862949 RepID=UPI001CD4AAA9|nr:acyl-CoA synthetase [Nocardia sp. alder85J]MCX4095735.1 acyl-CoA synthetase [Nocardia sp. alder85J]